MRLLFLTTVLCVLVALSFLNEATELHEPHDWSTENREQIADESDDDVVDELEKELEKKENLEIGEQNDEETKLNKVESDVRPAASDEGEELEDPGPRPRPTFSGRSRRRRRWFSEAVKKIIKDPKKLLAQYNTWKTILTGLGDEPQNDAAYTGDEAK